MDYNFKKIKRHFEQSAGTILVDGEKSVDRRAFRNLGGVRLQLLVIEEPAVVEV
jgi:hypothetical protein